MLTTIDFRWFMGLSRLPWGEFVPGEQEVPRCFGCAWVALQGTGEDLLQGSRRSHLGWDEQAGVCHRPQVLTPGHRQWKNPLDFPETGMCYFAKALLTDMHTIIGQLIDDPSKMVQR